VNRGAGCFGFNCRMVVIFGFGPGSQEDQGEVAPCVCPNCHNQVFLHYVRSKKSVRLYFVPVVPYGTDSYLVCPVCSRGLQVSDAQLRHVRSMSSATASFRAGRLSQARYRAQADRFWRQLGVNPAGQRLLTPASPGAAARPGPIASSAGRFWWMAVEQPGVADLLVSCLEREGVTVIFGIPGEENIRFTDALVRSPIRYVLVRHEQAASFMAEIYGRLTGRAGVCSATLGPGAINLLLGTADATTNSSPVMALSAQVGLNRIYKESHQSVDLVAMFACSARALISRGIRRPMMKAPRQDRAVQAALAGVACPWRHRLISRPLC
jgi:uncharacterized protein YbaR (Trm112 family)